MPVHIYDADAFEKLVTVEGEGYRQCKSEEDFGECSFDAFQKEWKGLDSTTLRDSRPVFAISVNHGATGAIYGLGGWNRYVVLNTGEILLIEESVAREGDIRKAREAGFRIFPRDIHGT